MNWIGLKSDKNNNNDEEKVALTNATNTPTNTNSWK